MLRKDDYINKSTKEEHTTTSKRNTKKLRTKRGYKPVESYGSKERKIR
jgi:hypothetical protein